jgi:hypothetical protein
MDDFCIVCGIDTVSGLCPVCDAPMKTAKPPAAEAVPSQTPATPAERGAGKLSPWEATVPKPSKGRQFRCGRREQRHSGYNQKLRAAEELEQIDRSSPTLMALEARLAEIDARYGKAVAA